MLQASCASDIRIEEMAGVFGAVREPPLPVHNQNPNTYILPTATAPGSESFQITAQISLFR